MTLQIPHTFVAGTKAKALEMNDNFTACEDAINASISDITTNISALASLTNVALKEDGSVNSSKLQSYTAVSITNATNAIPIVITATKHGRSTGDRVNINGVLGNTAANGVFYVNKIDENTFSLVNSVGSGAYTSGGIVYLMPSKSENLVSKIYVDSALTSVIPSNYIDGLTLSCSSTILTGTVTTTASSSILTGSGTLFMTEAPVGAILVINGVSYTVTAVANNTSLTLSALAPSAYSGSTAYKIMNSIITNPGVCSDSSNELKMTLASAITKKLDAAWVSGSNNGGLDTGLKAINSWYYAFVIAKADGTTDALFSLSATAPTLPSGYNYFRRVGSIKTDASGNIIPFNQIGDYFYWQTMQGDIYIGSDSMPTVRTQYKISVPPNTRAIFQCVYNVGTNGIFTASFFEPNENSTFGAHIYTVNGYPNAGQFQKFVNANSQIALRSNTYINSYFYVNTEGYIDRRGKN